MLVLVLHGPISMLLTLLLIQVTDKIAFPDVLVAPPAPVAVDAKVMPPLKYRLRRIRKPGETKRWNQDGSFEWRIGGRWYRFKVPEGGWKISEITPGRDGSAVIEYSFQMPVANGAEWADNPPHKEQLKKVHDPEGWYQDRKNFVSADYEEGIMFPESPYTLTQTIDGEKRKLGWGSAVRTWWPRDILANQRVDEKSRPASMDYVDHDFLRFYHDGVPTEIGDYEFLGALADRTLILAKQDVVYLWSRPSFRSAVKLPFGWKPITYNKKGEVLVRNWLTDSVPVHWQKDERVWKMGILSGDKLFPLQFSRPANTRKLSWDESESTLDEKGRYRFHASARSEERFFELVPVAGRL